MRDYTRLATSHARTLLNVLSAQDSTILSYQQAMTELGYELGKNLASVVSVEAAGDVCLVCTVEDADFLAKGMLEGMRGEGIHAERLKLVCFWNDRVRHFEGTEAAAFDVAPILKQYREAIDVEHVTLVVVKSIISGACVVKTNIMAMIDDMDPKKVVVAAPVMSKGADRLLAEVFPPDMAKRFEYFTFAIDDQYAADQHTLIPGVGGSVYERLGFEGDNRLKYIPEIVRQRRQAFLAV